MSAFELSDKHLRYLVYAWRRYAAPPGSGITIMGDELDGLAMMLKYENRRSLAHRYPRDNKPCPACGAIVCDPGWQIRIGVIPSFVEPSPEAPAICPFARVDRFPADSLGIDPVGAIKSAQCYEYQSNEHPEWETSQAKRFVVSLIERAIAKLPGYDAAPWGIA